MVGYFLFVQIIKSRSVICIAAIVTLYLLLGLTGEYCDGDISVCALFIDFMAMKVWCISY